MRKSIGLFLATAFVMFTTAFTNHSSFSSPSESTNPEIFKIMEVTHLWDLLNSTYEPIRERDGTWLDVGLRSKYAMAKNYASLEILEQTFGEPIFIRGPHGSTMDFNSTTSFGYYNPAFIIKVHQTLDEALQNPMFKKVATSVYNQHLKSIAHTYQDAFRHIEQESAIRQQLTNDYLLAMAQPAGTMEGSLQESFRGYAEAAEKSDRKADVYESFTAPSFWIRRHIDGTADEFKQLLEMAMTHLEDGK